MLVESHLGTLATLTVFFSSQFEVWSTSRLSTAFRWVFQAPTDLIVLGGERPDPNRLSFLRHARKEASVRPEVLVTAARLKGKSGPPPRWKGGSCRWGVETSSGSSSSVRGLVRGGRLPLWLVDRAFRRM